MAALIVEDLVSHKWLATIASVEETSTQVELAFTAALAADVGYVCPNDEHEGRGKAIRKARHAGLETSRLRRLAWHRQHRQDQLIQDPNDVG
jgi:hypothetical protein